MNHVWYVFWRHRNIRTGALIRIGALITKTHSKGGAYSEGGAYWKERAKSNHYGNYTLNEDFRVMPNSTLLETLIEIKLHAFGGVFFAAKSILRMICKHQASSARVENSPLAALYIRPQRQTKRVPDLWRPSGCFPFCQRFRKFQLDFKWRDSFRFLLTGIFGITSGGGPHISVVIFRPKFAVPYLWQTGLCALIWEFGKWQ